MTSLSSISESSAWSLLNRLPELGPVRIAKLLLHYTSVQEVLHRVARGSDGIPQASKDYLRQPPWKEIEAEQTWLNEHDASLVHLQHADYPPLLKQIPACPPVIYLWGKAEIVQNRQLAIVGSRNPSHQGREQAYAFARALVKQNWVVTSGLAIGVDTAAHQGSLSAGATVAVLGTGLDRVYPNRNKDLAEKIRQAGVLVSEFPIGSVAKPYHFPRRNRIISGLSLGTLVVEASVKSGSLITAKYAAEQGREVFALPGSINNPLAKGCHELIRQGAKLVENLQHIVEEFPNLSQMDVKSNTLAEQCNLNKVKYTNILNYLGYEPTPVDLIIERSGLSSEEVSSQLLVLELQGSVQTTPGGHYVRVK